MSGALEIRGVSVALGGRPVLDGLDLDLAAGAYGAVLGKSGSGKTTLLRAIAGLVEASGTISIGGRVVSAGTQVVPPEERSVGFLFQGLALWPHMTVEGHLRYALAGRGVPRGEQAARLDAVLDPLGISALRGRRPAEISGGERQRLALARALVTRPALLLLDEPTSSVDPGTRREVLDLLARINREFGTTVLHVTHDQEEALELGDRVFVMQDGRFLQGGTAEEIYLRPASAAVAAFVGEGALVPAVVSDGTADSPLGRIAIEPGGPSGAVWILLRPEHLGAGGPGEGVPATVERAAYRGGHWRARVRLAEQVLFVDLPARLAEGDALRVKVVRAPRAVEVRRNP